MAAGTESSRLAWSPRDMSETICVTITRQEKYRFLVDFGENIPNIVSDEPPPLGDKAGPSPQRLLGAAIANCLCGSLVFAVNKFKGDPDG
jgi:uncharacterized OsmC-like protein